MKTERVGMFNVNRRDEKMRRKNSLILNRVLISNVLNDVVQCLGCCPSMPFPPHKFIQVAGNHLLMTALHAFDFCLASVPIQLDVLGVRSCGRVHKL